ncbi:helix-turn-helix domain-containing protein [Streptomyces avicenniae]|uniref:helix-turn-helix domain-containing protein n=1 Tax=Streptomyces avicenniae TaxID=500153 RepID=UPI00069C6034|nr:helix-turn-helix transcriptional regulator [Streptomyces avicenniae]
MADPRRGLAEFLRSRRDRTRPEDVGLTGGGRRRSPGLRRAEVAHLAGISVEYYVRLEQGRGVNPSAAVLDALARVFELGADEREHLRTLAGRGGAPPPPAPAERVRPGTRRLLEKLDPTPAYVLGRRLDVLAWNGMAAALFPGVAEMPPARRNLVRYAFTHPGARTFYVDWPTMARRGIAHVRMSAGRHPGDPAIAALVGELSLHSEDFRTWWARHDVRNHDHGRKRFAHPAVGRVNLRYEALRLPGPGDLSLVTYLADEGGPEQDALDRLDVLRRG